MSLHGHMQDPDRDYSDGRTKQAFKDQTDINRILQKYQKTGTISHLAKHGAFYGDFTGFDGLDFQQAQNRLIRGNRIFEELPSEIRREFDNKPSSFFKFVNDPANRDRLPEVLPQLAKPGRQLPPATNTAATVAAREANSTPQSGTTPPASGAPA